MIADCNVILHVLLICSELEPGIYLLIYEQTLHHIVRFVKSFGGVGFYCFCSSFVVFCSTNAFALAFRRFRTRTSISPRSSFNFRCCSRNAARSELSYAGHLYEE